MGGELFCMFPVTDLPWVEELREYASVLDYSARIPKKVVIVHSHYNPSSRIALVTAARLRAIHIAHWHAAPPEESRLKSLAKRALFHFVTHHITVSEHVAQALGKYGVPAERISVVHNGVDLRRFSPHQTGPTGKIAVIANFRPEKDHVSFLHSMALLRDIPLKAVLVGDGPTRPDMERLASELEQSDRVEFVGKQADIPAILHTCSFAVLPTREEAFPYSLVEAMACGLPVIAAATGGVPEIVKHNKNGLLYPVGDAESLAQAIRRLYLEQELRLRLTRGALETACNLTVDKWVTRILSVYGRFTERSSTPRNCLRREQPFRN